MPDTWKLAGYDAFAEEDYPLGDITDSSGKTIDGMKPSYDSYEEALADAKKRLAHLERTQPSASSGGQGGIQDRVFIIHPDGHRQRVSG